MLPPDDEQQASLLYQDLLQLEYGEGFSFRSFCIAVFGKTNLQEMVDAFNSELVQKFTRQVEYRLAEIEEDTQGQSETKRESIVVFHHHDNSTNISGSVYGSNIATGNARISESNATYNSTNDIAAELRSMKADAAAEAQEQREALRKLLESLASAAESDAGDVATVADQARSVAEISPTIGSRLKEMVTGVASSLAESLIVKGLSAYFGLPD